MKSYGLRKFLIAALSIVSVTGLAAYSHMTNDVAMVLLAVNVAFHGANAYISRNGNGKTT